MVESKHNSAGPRGVLDIRDLGPVLRGYLDNRCDIAEGVKPCNSASTAMQLHADMCGDEHADICGDEKEKISHSAVLSRHA
jgi:hypothetical protein